MMAFNSIDERYVRYLIVFDAVRCSCGSKWFTYVGSKDNNVLLSCKSCGIPSYTKINRKRIEEALKNAYN